jgi:hypothetical protein
MGGQYLDSRPGTFDSGVVYGAERANPELEVVTRASLPPYLDERLGDNALV